MIKPKIKFYTVVLAIAMLTGIQASYAEGDQTSDNVTLNVTLEQVQSISVNTNQKTVNLVFQSASDYQDGVSSTQVDHLNVSSTTSFQVKVTALGDLSNSTSGDAIPVSTITVTPTVSSGYSGPAEETLTGTSLSTSDQGIINSGTNGTVETHYDVEYKASGGENYINKSVGTYTTTVTYTISPA